MIKLIRGNIDNLEGKVLVFSRLEPMDGESQIMSLYAATNLLDFVDKAGLPRESIGELEKQIIADARQVKEKMGITCSEEEFMAKILPIYITPVPISQEGDLYCGDEDVLDVGTFSSPTTCLEMLNEGIKIYMLKHEDSVQRRHGLKPEIKDKKNKVKEEQTKPTYKNVEKPDFRKYITDNFIVPILDSYSQGKPHLANEVASEFFKFSSESLFVGSVVDLMREIDKTRDRPNLPIIEAYVNMVVAINNEDYVTAAKMRDKIKVVRQ